MTCYKSLLFLIFLEFLSTWSVPINDDDDIKPPTITSPTKTRPEDFDIVCPLGKGGFGNVFKARKNRGFDQGTCYALKCIEKTLVLNQNTAEKVKREKDIPLKIDHPNVVKLMYTFQTDSHLFFGMELVEGGDLAGLLKKKGPFLEEAALFYVTEIVLAIEHLHAKDVVHRDLKPSNVLLDSEGHIKITDFGLSRRLGEGERAFSKCGTLAYTAPEVLVKNAIGYDKTVDWFGLGSMMYEMLTMKTPREKIQEMKLGVRSSSVVCANPISPGGKEFIKSLIEPDPEKRLGRKGAKEVKSCSYLENVNWQDVNDRKIPPPLIPEIIQDTDRSINLSDMLSRLTRSAISDEQQKLFKHFSSVLNFDETDNFV